jgi:hypothetical protein
MTDHCKVDRTELKDYESLFSDSMGRVAVRLRVQEGRVYYTISASASI